MGEKHAFKQNIHRLFDEAAKTELTPGIVSLLESKSTKLTMREVPLDRILPNPAQPRLSYEEEGLTELADSIREHGVLQPIIVRQVGDDFELIAGERRWRASGLAGLHAIPAIVSEVDDRTALELSIIENLQREDLSPLEEAKMYQRMTADLGYSVRALAQRVGKDKGYIENRLRLADAPAEIRELVTSRHDTLSHAYELMKVRDERTRRRLAARVAAGELTLAKLRARINPGHANGEENGAGADANGNGRDVGSGGRRRRARTIAGEFDAAREAGDDSLLGAKGRLASAVDELVELLRRREVLDEIPQVNRENFAKYLTITKLKLENAIALIRAGD